MGKSRKKGLTVWVDADSCPAQVRNIIAGETSRYESLNVVFSANRQIPCPRGNHVGFHLSSQEKDSADQYILDNAQKEDIVITKDFLMAQKALIMGITVMNFDGRVFEIKWLEKRIEERNLMEILYKSGSISPYKKKSRSSSQDKDFTLSFSRELHRISNKELNNEYNQNE